ncbi:MAG: GIY-YIG nuclease family protein [Bacteroidota bacterium]
MYYTYVLYSPGHKRLYKGHCKNPYERLKQHNSVKILTANKILFKLDKLSKQF